MIAEFIASLSERRNKVDIYHLIYRECAYSVNHCDFHLKCIQTEMCIGILVDIINNGRKANHTLKAILYGRLQLLFVLHNCLLAFWIFGFLNYLNKNKII